MGQVVELAVCAFCDPDTPNRRGKCGKCGQSIKLVRQNLAVNEPKSRRDTTGAWLKVRELESEIASQKGRTGFLLGLCTALSFAAGLLIGLAI